MDAAQTFSFDKYGRVVKLFVGQKVQCGYYHEYPRWYMRNAYKRSLWQRFFTRPFRPVKCGVIVGDAGIHPFWLGTHGHEQYLFVKFKHYYFKKAIPISCIEDALEWAEKTEKSLLKDLPLMGQKGFDPSDFETLGNWAKTAREFATSS